MAIIVGGEIFFTLRLSIHPVCYFSTCWGRWLAINLSYCTIQFLSHNYCRDISYENIYVVSKSTEGVGGLVKYCIITQCTGVEAGLSQN